MSQSEHDLRGKNVYLELLAYDHELRTLFHCKWANSISYNYL